MPITEVTDLNIEELKLFSSQRENSQYIVCDSEKVVLKLLKSSSLVIKILSDSKFFSRYPDIVCKYNCFQAPKVTLEKIVGHRLHQGIMALAIKPKFSTLDDLTGPICILNGLTSPENVGAIVRTLAALNIKSLILDSKSASPYIRRAIRVSMGNVFDLKIHQTGNLIETISLLKNRDYQIIATANESGATIISDVLFTTKSAFIIGSEGHGIDPIIKKSSTLVSFIPVTENVLHLNASNAATIFAYECSKQLKLI